MNCPRCNMILAQGAQTCPNCHLNIQQYMYHQHQPGPMYGAPPMGMESAKEKIYKKLLVVIAIVMMSEFVVAVIPFWSGLYSISRITTWLSAMIYAAIPLVIAIILPKGSGRITLIVFASVYILLRLLYAYWLQSWYGMWDYLDMY